MTKRTSEMMR